MKINLIIATYAGRINKLNFNNEKDNYLKYNIKILDNLNLNLQQITIMKPTINNEHIMIEDYYNFGNLKNIGNKIKIIECENIGISYGQLFNGIINNLDFDYHIFIEDDYIFFRDNAILDLLEEFRKLDNDSLLCSFIYKNRKWNLLNHCKNLKENPMIIKLLKNKLQKNNINIQNNYNIPDFSLCIFSKNTVNKIFNCFNYDSIIDLFSIKFGSIWLHQILFGLILFESGVKIYDLTDYSNIFYNTKENNITLCFNNKNIHINKLSKFIKKKLELPIFIPLDVFFFKSIREDMNLISKNCDKEMLFINNLDFLGKILN